MNILLIKIYLLRSILILLLIPRIVFSQIPNSDFELWYPNNGTEEPIDWGTNNYPTYNESVMKTTDSYSGDYAILVQSEGPNFEGKTPGVAHTVFIPDQSYNNIKAFVKCAVIDNPGYASIELRGYYGTTIPVTLAFWITWEPIMQYSEINIPVVQMPVPDSVRLEIIGGSFNDSIGFHGYGQIIADHISLTNETANPEINNQHFSVFPNPATETLVVRLETGSTDRMIVCDVNGKPILQADLTAEEIAIDIKKLPAGLYLVRFEKHNAIVGFNKFMKSSTIR